MLASDHLAIACSVRLPCTKNARKAQWQDKPRSEGQRLPRHWDAEDECSAHRAAARALCSGAVPPDPRCRVKVAVDAAVHA
eukprot:8238579-Alexandrium_andersonii.AAC.1